MLRGRDSNPLRKLMGLPGKPFPTLPRAAQSAEKNLYRQRFDNLSIIAIYAQNCQKKRLMRLSKDDAGRHR